MDTFFLSEGEVFKLSIIDFPRENIVAIRTNKPNMVLGVYCDGKFLFIHSQSLREFLK
jgi:hypothetical protein